MSWFFGKKKNKESPPESGEEASPTANQPDDYVIIEKTSNPSAINFDNRNNPVGPSFGLYPFIGGTDTGAPSVPSTISPMNVLCDGQSYLSCIKFRLDKSFESDTDMDRLRTDEILSFILRIKTEDYNYDFSLENSVINEMQINIE